MRIALRPRALAAVALAGSVALSLPTAHADPRRGAVLPIRDEVQACIDASDRGQSLRIDKHLRAAKTEFALCARRACPGEIRDKCAQWLDETERAIPGVVFLVKDAAGADVDPVQIRVDDVVVSARYDGSVLTLDPGEHVVRFEAAGKAPLAKTLRLAQGERDRQEKVVLLAPADDGVASRAGAAGEGSASRGEGLRNVSFVAGGLGLAGIVTGSIFGALAIAANGRARCAPNNVCVDPSDRRDAQGLATGSTVGFVAGGALLAAGVVLFFVAPRSAPPSLMAGSARLQVVPLASTRGGGALLEATW